MSFESVEDFLNRGGQIKKVSVSDVWKREKKKSIPNYINWNKVHETRKKIAKEKAVK